MTDRIKLPRKDEPSASTPLRPSREKVLENLERWANSRELQPPKLLDADAT